MKKLFTALICATMVLGLSGCGSTNTLESELKGNEDAIDTINTANKELAVETLKFKEYDEALRVAVYSDDKLEVNYYINDDGTMKEVYIKNVGGSDDYSDAVNATFKMSCLGLTVGTNNQIVGYFNNGNTDETNIDGYITRLDTNEFYIKNKTDESLSMAIPVTIDEIELKDFHCETDSIGTVYMKAKFKNNSKKTITYIQYSYEVDGDKTYLMCTDTLLPGDTSTVEDTFGPSSKDVKDATLLKASITVKDENADSDIYIDYDAKTKEYSWH